MFFLQTAATNLAAVSLTIFLAASGAAQSDISFSDGRDPATVLQTVADSRGTSIETATTAARRAAAIERDILDTAEDWMGTPYRWGGDSRRGIDCSAFVRRIYREAFDIELTRTTATQVQEGHYTRKNELQAGDLVFFRRGNRRHVGIYLRNGDFLHASSSDGVKISNLSERYYSRYYWTSRRFDVDTAAGRGWSSRSNGGHVAPTPRDKAREEQRMLRNASPPREADNRRRVGW